MILKHRDVELLTFDWVDGHGVRIVSVNDQVRHLLPLEFRDNLTDEALWRWLNHRVIPANRSNAERLLRSVGLAPGDTCGIIEISRGLSLNDVYWVVPLDSAAKWQDNNLYDNPFSKALQFAAFTGAGITSPDKWTTSPEFTTNGMLAKCWHRAKGEILLYKSGTEGGANSGNEPYSEFLASQLAEALGIDHVSYDLAKYKGRLCSTCPLFTSDKVGFVPIGRLKDRDSAISDARFSWMFLFDALIFNTDRHLGNFGYLIDNDTNEIIGAAPFFDNGYGLFSRAIYKNKYVDDFNDLSEYAKGLKPALYDDWLSFPGGLDDAMKAGLDRLVGFRFKRHRYYNLPSGRVSAIESFLQERISEILGLCGNMYSSSTLDRLRIAIKTNPLVTQNELAKLLGVSRVTVAYYIGKLRDKGEIVRIGSDRTGRWELR